MKILTVVGARPQFIKAAVVSREIQKRKGLEEVIVHTGQHFDYSMSEKFFEELEIPNPNYHLNINQLSHAKMTAQMMSGLEEVLLKERPEIVLLYGDTNSTLAGALTSAKLNIPIAHVEAGLRSFNMNMPEEINRILADKLSDYLYCPTKRAMLNLQNEGINNSNSHVRITGDVMYDAVLYYLEKAKRDSKIKKTMGLTEYVVCTMHREENTDNESNLRSIIAALEEINKKIKVIFPIHPRTKKSLENINLSHSLHVVEPLGYFDMLCLIDSAKLVLTDSGGLQKEAYYLSKPCITLREETEWLELLDLGVNKLATANKDIIIEIFDEMNNLHVSSESNLFGNGDAAIKVVDDILNVEI